MSLIIDANRASDFNIPLKSHAVEILKRTTSRRLTIVVGGRLLRELTNTHIRDLIVEWSRVGLIKRCDDNAVSDEERRYSSLGIKCDDPHVLALASVSEARLLYTDDKNLVSDFKNIRLLKPKGKVVGTNTKAKVANLLFDRYAK